VKSTKGLNRIGGQRIQEDGKRGIPDPTVLEISIRKKEIQNEWDPLTEWLRRVERTSLPEEIRDLYGFDQGQYQTGFEMTIPFMKTPEVG
jgi:hypothetical protein